MAFIPVDNTVQVEMRYTWGTEEVENTLYFHNDGGWTPTLMNVLASALYDWWDEQLKALQSNTVTLREIYLRDLANATSWSATFVPPGTATGTATGESLPNNVSLCISFRSLQVGRSYRGRNFSIGMTETHTTGSTANATYVNALETAYTNLATYTDPLSHSHVIVSRYTNGAPRSEGVIVNVATYVVVDSVVDSQRRRLPGRGT